MQKIVQVKSSESVAHRSDRVHKCDKEEGLRANPHLNDSQVTAANLGLFLLGEERVERVLESIKKKISQGVSNVN
jgi:hypothetical protein